MTDIDKFLQIINKSKRIVFFGGAGVSTESGIPDFRSADGLYGDGCEYSPEDILSHSFFVSHTAEFFRFYRDKMLYPSAKPNVTHFALAKLEKQGKLLAVITQNIDGLHEKAGSQNVINLHGTVYSNTCLKCGKHFDLQAVLQNEGIPHCSCGGVIKPDVVLYQEQLSPQAITDAVSCIRRADCLIVGGTSLVVQPAAGLINYFFGENLVLINKQQTMYDSKADLVLHCGLGEVFGEIYA